MEKGGIGVVFVQTGEGRSYSAANCFCLYYVFSPWPEKGIESRQGEIVE